MNEHQTESNTVKSKPSVLESLTQEHKAAILHFSFILNSLVPFGSIIIAVVTYFVTKNDFIKSHAREHLNATISYSLYGMGLLIVGCVGAFLILLLGVLGPIGNASLTILFTILMTSFLIAISIADIYNGILALKGKDPHFPLSRIFIRK